MLAALSPHNEAPPTVSTLALLLLTKAKFILTDKPGALFSKLSSA